MSIVPFISAIPFLLIGLHLLRVARASGAVPDRLLSAFFLLCSAAIVPRMVALDLVTSGTGMTWTAFWLSTVGNLIIGTSILCLCAFTWKVFRPDAGWAKKLVIAFVVAYVFTFAARASSLENAQASSPVAILYNVLGAASLAWAFVECVIYYLSMRRRLALGLADPVVANRFLLWSLWTGAIAIQALVMVALRAAVGWSGAGEILNAGGDPGGPWLDLIRAGKALFGVVAPVVVVSVVLSFSPPAAYLRWLRKEPTGAAAG